ncbi:hypothetical protein E2C01_013814 [Portunus trituberculatus]|uniref:Uncharacterized protein n=1 Tax=Portunus trituberculatus TaxID=210409 RepID=A0A5B7DID2_PORTR|nr:hypothetical protein [Portunus trituberculatus]
MEESLAPGRQYTHTDVGWTLNTYLNTTGNIDSTTNITQMPYTLQSPGHGATTAILTRDHTCIAQRKTHQHTVDSYKLRFRHY